MKNEINYVYIETNDGIYKIEKDKLLKNLEVWDEFVIRLNDLKE